MNTTYKAGKFNIRLVHKGETYGLNNCLTHTGDEPYIEFYDSRYGHTEHGQFITRYYLSTILDGDAYSSPVTGGLVLQGGVDEWTIGAADLQPVLAQIRHDRTVAQ